MKKISISALTERGRKALQLGIDDFNKLPWVSRQQYKLMFTREVTQDPLTLTIKVKNGALTRHLRTDAMKEELIFQLKEKGAYEQDFKIEVEE